MNTFRTEIQPAIFEDKINYNDKIYCIGSCFAQNIHQKFKDYAFDTFENPLGIVYNPISIFENILPKENQIIINKNNIYYSYQTHSQIFANSENELIQKLEFYKNQIIHQIKNTQWLIITLGTAMVYKLKNEQQIVANCHKMPADIFEKYLLSSLEINVAFDTFYNKLIEIQPNIRIILTVSPVRHLKETLEINAVSKAILRLFCHEKTNNKKNIYYFPAFEILQDDLRDYRFYEADMLHPTSQAIDYVWQKFLLSSMETETIKNANLCYSVFKDLQHKPFHPNTTEHLQFLKKIKNKIENCSNFTNMETHLKNVVEKIKKLEIHLQS